MTRGRWALMAVLATLAITVIEGIGHGWVMASLYQETASVWRPLDEMNRLLWLGWLSTLVSSFVLVYIFHRGYENRGSRIGEGLRFGALLGVLQGAPMAVWTWVMLPIGAALAFGWFVLAMLDMLAAGVVIAMLYRPAEPGAAALARQEA